MSAICPQRSSLQDTLLLRGSQLLLLNSFAEASATVWAEIDIEKRTWSIPAERMKDKRDHIVPLFAQALELLDTMCPILSAAITNTSSQP